MQTDANDSMQYFPKEQPTIHTKRLTLRPLTQMDEPQLIDCLNNYNVAKTMGAQTKYPFQKQQFQEFYNKILLKFQSKLSVTFSICFKETPTVLMGLIFIVMNKKDENASLGYFLNEKEWRKGYMTESLEAVIKYGFEVLHLHKIDGCHYETNIASGRVMAKCGMVLEIKQTDNLKKFGKYNNVITYGIINQANGK